MKNYFYLLVLFLLLAAKSYGQGSVEGTVIDTLFFSASLNETRNVQIYLPEEYDLRAGSSFPVIYYLHGFGAPYTSYPFIFEILDELISNQVIDPVILVRPDGSTEPYTGSWYANSELYGLFEDYIVYDLVHFIDSNYRTVAESDKRTIMGHSMGGVGAMKLALKHPDIYCGVVSHSGPLDYNQWPSLFHWVLTENGGNPPYNYNPNAGFMTHVFFSIAGARSGERNVNPSTVSIYMRQCQKYSFRVFYNRII